MADGRRTFGPAVLAGIVGSGLVALAGSKPWAAPDGADAATGSRWVRWSSAGHPPPVLLTGDGQVRVLPDRPGLPLGVQPSAPRPDHATLLPPSGTLVLYTDGLVECRGQNIEAGIESLRRAVAALDIPLRDVPEALVRTRLPQGPEDDVALLVARVCG